MAKGRKPKPNKMLKLHGTFRDDRRPVVEIESSGKPMRPRSLSKEARSEWDRIVPDLDKIGLLSKVDRAALYLLCESWADYVHAQELIEEHGAVLMGDGFCKKNPACTVAHEAFSRWNTMCAKFGLTPSDRAKMPQGEPNEVDPLDKLLSKRIG